MALPELQFESTVFETRFHPSQDLIATGCVDGKVHIHTYTKESATHVKVLEHHTSSVRALRWSLDGSLLYTGSADCSLQAVDASTGQVVACRQKAHSHGINASYVLTENLVATGDDNGCVKVWDTRKSDCAMEFDDNKDYINDFAYSLPKKTLLAASGDGTLAAYDLRKKGGKLIQKSDNQENEMLSVEILKGGTKVVVGTQEGIIDIFNWGEFRDISDRFPGHPESIESIIAVDEDTICSGSSDGIIRVVSILPNKLIGVVGAHDFPIERLDVSHCKNILASVSHDDVVKFWDVSYVFDEDSEGDADAPEVDIQALQPSAGMQEEDSDSWDDTSDDEEPPPPPKPAAKPKKGKKGRQFSNSFFADM